MRIKINPTCGVSMNVRRPFETTWLLEEADKTITLPLRTGFTYDMMVDWGDLTLSRVTSYNDPNRIHTYTTAGTKTVKITGTCQAWYFNNAGDKLKFRTVEQWGDVGFTGGGLYSAFYGCSNATSFGARMPPYPVTSLFSTWFGCSSATSFPEVNNLTLVNTLYYTWYGCSSATSFPEVNNLTLVNTLNTTWYNCSSATSFPDVNALTLVNTLAYTWRNCSSATSFPEVNNLTLVTTLAYTWRGCSSCTTVPVLPAASTALTTTTSAFQDIGAGMLGTVSDLWNAANFPNITSYANTFTGATGLTNYAAIPNGWKGL